MPVSFLIDTFGLVGAIFFFGGSYLYQQTTQLHQTGDAGCVLLVALTGLGFILIAALLWLLSLLTP